MQGCYRPSRKSANGGKGRRTALYFASTIGGFSAEAIVEVTKSVRRLQVTFLPFAHRWPRMSGLTVSECVLPTHKGQSRPPEADVEH
jgi:hypothetical protein